MENDKIYEKDILNALVVGTLMNNYVLENVTFGKLKPGDKLPFDKFVEDLDLKKYNPYAIRDYIGGSFISSETVAEIDEDEFLKECFIFHVNFVFMSAPKHKGDFGDDGLTPFKFGLNEYILSLYPLFKEIVKTEAAIGHFDVMPIFEERHDEALCYEKISKFLVAIKTKRLRQGACVERYVKDIPYMPIFVQRLLMQKKNRRYLANGDTESTGYKLAVLSAIHFMKFEHTKLFELKALAWENKNK